jgi:opacity protein-like surface antigen
MNFRLLGAAVVAAVLTTSAASADGMYASVLGGGTWDPHVTLGGAHPGVNSGFNAGGRIGYGLDDLIGMSGFAVEGDVFYNQQDFKGSQARLSSVSFMGDLIYHVDTGTPFGVYGGGGVGAVRTMVNGGGFDGSGTVLGWQALGGVDYRITPDAKVFAEYRYQNAHDANIAPLTPVGNTSNNVSVGLKFEM